MKVSGYKISGGSYIGRASLGTVAEPLFWYDHRFNNSQDPTGRHGIWNSLTSLGSTQTQSIVSRKLYYHTSPVSGYGYKIGDGFSTYQTLGNHYPALDVMHKGANAWMFSIVFYWKQTDSGTSGATSLIRTGLTAGITGIIDHNQPRIRLQTRGSSSTINNLATATNSVPDDQVSIVTFVFYGDTSSNNYRIIINNSNTNFTSNPTYDTASSEYLRFGLPVTQLNDFIIKMMIAYDLSGKSRSEVDSILSTYYTVLKTDSEYSSLVTP